MKIKDVFSEVLVGYNLNNAGVKDNYSKYYKTLQKESIQYTNIISKKLIEKAFSSEIKSKFFIQERDILIFVKKPYRVGAYSGGNLEVVVPNNFIILRGIDRDKYSYIFVANYLEKFGIEKFVKDEHITGNLSIEDVKNIELPDISKEEQMKISSLLRAINDRSALYSNILENDEKIVCYALNKVVGEQND